ncbi:MAG: magnesium transporter CorA family protein, partial [Patescibacteria group bacterium]
FPYFKQNGNHSTQNDQEKKNKTSVANLLSLPHAALSSIPLFQFSGAQKRRILTSHINLFIGKEYVVVVHEGILTPINDIFVRCQKTLRNRNELMGQGSAFLAYKIIDMLVDYCFLIINELIVMIEKIDRELEVQKTQIALEEISITRRNIVFFLTMIKPILPLFKHLEEGEYKELNGQMTDYWSNVYDHLKKIGHRLEDSRELIEGISESNESLLSARTNEIIKVLTIFSAIILPLNLVASIYGMNIEGLPFSQDQSSFTILLLMMFTLGSIMLIAFKARRWF